MVLTLQAQWLEFMVVVTDKNQGAKLSSIGFGMMIKDKLQLLFILFDENIKHSTFIATLYTQIFTLILANIRVVNYVLK